MGETDDYNKEDSLGEFNDRYIEDLSEDNMDLHTNDNFIEEESREYANKDINLRWLDTVSLFLIAIIAIECV